MKQLIKEQLSQFEKQKEVYMTHLRAYYHSQWNGTDEEKEVYRIEAEKSRNVLNEWYVTSLKQFIDELIDETQNQTRGEILAHLKELKEELN